MPNLSVSFCHRHASCSFIRESVITPSCECLAIASQRKMAFLFLSGVSNKGFTSWFRKIIRYRGSLLMSDGRFFTHATNNATILKAILWDQTQGGFIFATRVGNQMFCTGWISNLSAIQENFKTKSFYLSLTSDARSLFADHSKQWLPLRIPHRAGIILATRCGLWPNHTSRKTFSAGWSIHLTVRWKDDTSIKYEFGVMLPDQPANKQITLGSSFRPGALLPAD